MMSLQQQMRALIPKMTNVSDSEYIGLGLSHMRIYWITRGYANFRTSQFADQ